MQPDPSIPVPPAGSAAEKLLDAAAVVFARMGIGGATTREIAREAGVNEVTLFRNFQNKQGLLSAVLKRAFLPPAGDRVQPVAPAAGGAGLRAMLAEFALADYRRKQGNIALLRVLLGELHALGDQETEVLRQIFKPWKDELADRLREAQELGAVRPDVDPVIVVDQLLSLVFMGALRADRVKGVSYTPEAYLEACVDLVFRGIRTEPEASR